MCKYLTLAVVLSFNLFVSAANWPAWRGPTGNGVSPETEFPKTWSPTENITWKVKLPEPGNATPIVWGDKIFVAQATNKGSKRGIMCFDRKSGTLLWNSDVAFDGKELTHGDNPFCSATPVTDGEYLVAAFGSAGIAAFDPGGRKLWHRNDLGELTHIWGNASSPVIVDDLVITYCGPGLRCFIVALNKKDGTTAWKIDLPEAQAKREGDFFGAWNSPVIRETASGRELLLGLPKVLKAYDLKTQKETWACEGLGPLVYANALFNENTIVGMSGYGGAMMGLKTGGSGNITETNRLWRREKQNPQRVGSGVLIKDHVYILNDPGNAQCIDSKTGEIVWDNKVAGTSWSSMVCAGDVLYAIDMKGDTHLFRASPKYEYIGKNSLGELARASLALSDGQIFIRTYQNLYCIGKPLR